MTITETTIKIEAEPQTVWSVLDDLDRYPEWNPFIPRLSGLTVVGEALDGTLVIPDLPTPPLRPTLTRIVPGRELRWLSVVTGDAEFTAEHIFILEPEGDGTRFIHREVFDGPSADIMAEAIKNLVEPTYVKFNAALKKRAETLSAPNFHLHPSIAGDASPKAKMGHQTTLKCRCQEAPVIVQIDAPILHSHLCGCSKCWKPKGALFGLIAVVAADAVRIVQGSSKIGVVDNAQSIQRYACTDCGCHMVGKVDDRVHHFFGLAFVHPELSENSKPTRPEFAGFVSSLIEAGVSPSSMAFIRRALAEANIAAFDGFSSELSDLIAYHKVKIARVQH